MWYVYEWYVIGIVLFCFTLTKTVSLPATTAQSLLLSWLSLSIRGKVAGKENYKYICLLEQVFVRTHAVVESASDDPSNTLESYMEAYIQSAENDPTF